MFVRLTLHPAAVPVPTVIVPRPLPTVAHHAALPAGAGLTQLVLVVYLTESAKYASSAVTMFRRSDFIEEMYAFSFVLANFGIAIAAKMPMITTTINSSMSVKPLRFICTSPYGIFYRGTSHRWSLRQGACRQRQVIKVQTLTSMGRARPGIDNAAFCNSLAKYTKGGEVIAALRFPRLRVKPESLL